MSEMQHRTIRHISLFLALASVILINACQQKPATVFRPESIPKTAPDLQWSKSFGGVRDDKGRSVQQTTDGGYIVCGITESYGSGFEDIWLIKTDVDGNKLWDKTFGGKDIDVGASALQTTDDGYIICGSTYPNRASSEYVWLIKTDAEGNKLWDKTFGDSGISAGRSAKQTRDGGYIICGYTSSTESGGGGAWLIKTDADGNKLWDKAWGTTAVDIGTSVQQTADGGYVLCGVTGSSESGNQEALLIKTDADGNKLWDNTFKTEGLATASSVEQTIDGGYVICGSAVSLEADKVSAWLIKTDVTGNKLWDKMYSGEGITTGNSVQQTTNGGYIICGNIISYTTGKTDVRLVMTEEDGTELWEKSHSGEGVAQGESVQQTEDGGYIVCGTTKSLEGGGSRILLFKLAPEQ